MSLPAYLFLYDESGVQVKGDCLMPGREGAIEIMNSSYGVRQGVDSIIWKHDRDTTARSCYRP